MKKIYNILMMLALAVAGVSLTACSEDVVDTNQFMGDVSLSAYGPQPVVRGGYLRFVGSNLDQIREIHIPGVDPITNIEVIKAGIPSEIRIVVPKDGPETGIVKLISKSGKEILTKTALSYDEPITIDTILIKGKEVMPGETIKIQGDYLNLIHMVEFADGVWVSEDDFVSHDRYTIEVVVPEKARTGKLKLYTADLTKAEDPDALTYNIVPSNSALVVGTPVVAKFSSPRGEAEALGDVTIKQGETLTISGNFFTLVDSVKFGKDVYVKDLIFADDGGKTLKLVLPAAAPDGDVNLVAKSGVEIPVGTITTVAPSNCAAAPSPVKAGQPLTVTGNDLDVVVSITMNGAADPVEFSYADGKITINAVPETAVEGNLNLIMLNGKSTEVAFTLVKPAVTSYDNNPANAGGALTITGTNLDLVKSVAFGNGVYTVSEGDCSADGTTLKLTVPMDAQSGKPMLKLANGTEVEAPEITINEAVFCYVTEWPDEENTPEAGATMSVPVKNGEHLTNVYVNDEEVKFVFSAKTGVLVFYIPENAKAQSVVKLVSDNGEIEYKNVAVKPAGEITTKLWTGPKALGWSGDGQVYMGTDGGPELISLGAKAGDILRIKFTPTASDWVAQIWEGHWGTQFDEIKADNYDLEANKNCYYITLTDELIQQFTTAQGWGGIVLCQGQSMTVDELALIQKISQEIELWKGCETLGWSAEGQIYLLQDGGQQLIDNGAKVGSKLRIKFNPTADDWAAQIWEGHWGTQFDEIKAENYDLAANDNCYDIEITADLLQTFTTPQGWGGVVLTQGQSMQVVKVSLVP